MLLLGMNVNRRARRRKMLVLCRLTYGYGMSVWVRGRRLAVVAMVAVAVATGLIGAWSSDATQRSVARRAAGTMPPGAALLTVERGVSGEVVAPGFLGLSFEYWALENYAGRDAAGVNPVLVQLIRNLVPGQPAVLRIGGLTTDKTWWPVAGVSRPPGVNYTLTRRRLQVARALAEAVGGRLILGVNFEADSRVLAAGETRAMMAVIGSGRIEAFELGNEPELYGGRPWYRTRAGLGVLGRPADWDFAALNQDYTRVAGSMGSVPLAGPAIGALSWMADLSQFLADEPGVDIVTLHRYPLQSCSFGPGGSRYPTIGHLLSQTASMGLADTLAPFVAIAHGRGLAVRSDEMNSVSCGYVRGIADSFASALWSLDALFEMASVGVDGVNIHSYPGADDQLFAFTRVHSRWGAVVEPEYYGLLMFAQAAPAGSRLLQVTGASGTLRAWATRARSGRIRVVLINDDTAHPQTVVVRVPEAVGAATLERLQAPSARATEDVTLAGQSFAPGAGTGLLEGPSHTVLLNQVAGAYAVRLPAASAAMLTLR
jgi:Glycosyl hydrolase family 79 C-terminal beta domain